MSEKKMVRTERCDTRKIRDARVEVLEKIGHKCSTWTDLNQQKGDKKGSFYMIDIYEDEKDGN